MTTQQTTNGVARSIRPLCEYCGRRPAAAGSRYCTDEHRRYDAGNETTWRRSA